MGDIPHDGGQCHQQQPIPRERECVSVTAGPHPRTPTFNRQLLPSASLSSDCNMVELLPPPVVATPTFNRPPRMMQEQAAAPTKEGAVASSSSEVVSPLHQYFKGQSFSSLDDAFSALQTWSFDQGFKVVKGGGTKKRKTDLYPHLESQVHVSCSHSGKHEVKHGSNRSTAKTGCKWRAKVVREPNSTLSRSRMQTIRKIVCIAVIRFYQSSLPKLLSLRRRI